MSLKKQFILSFIPIVNFINVFFWLNFCRKNKVCKKIYFKGLSLIFVAFVIVSVINVFVDSLISSTGAQTIAHFIFMYIYLFVISITSVYNQNENKKTRDGSMSSGSDD